ncbi:MAG: hypothetical protein LIP02_03315 [Bacteroidales bacterium]|nr:hypothetical protein [Bacteroidales bacterium]
MKKLLYGTLALAALGLTACSNDDLGSGVDTTGQEVAVTVTATLPSNIQSRAFSDGEKALDMWYAVYEDGVTGPIIALNKYDKKFSGLQNTLTLHLITGKTYNVVFWAQSPEAETNDYFTLDTEKSTVTVNYDKIKDLNVEDADAFFCFKEVEVKGAATVTAELRRPFAQINVGTNDMEYAGLKDKQLSASMEVSAAFTQFSLQDGEVIGTAEPISFDVTPRPNQDKETTDDAYEKFPVGNKGDYEYLAMAYVLMSPDKMTTDVDLAFYDNGTRFHEVSVPNAPVQRNYRTNIFGALLTSQVDFTITINPEYETDSSYYIIDGKQYTLYKGVYYEVDTTSWKGDSDAPLYVDGEYLITSAAQFKGMADQVNTYGNPLYTGSSTTQNAGVYEKYVLLVDIDLANRPWTPVGIYSANVNGYNAAFWGDFNGNGHTISNLYIPADANDYTSNKGQYMALFGYMSGPGTIENFTIHNANVIGKNDVGILIGYDSKQTGSTKVSTTGHLVQNVKITGLVKVEATEYGPAYGIGGATIETEWNNIVFDVDEGSYIKSPNYAAALTGQVWYNGYVHDISSNIQIYYTRCTNNAAGSNNTCGGIFGQVYHGSTIENCHCSADIIYYSPYYLAKNYYGGIAGRWVNADDKVTTFRNCSFTGTFTVSGKAVSEEDALSHAIVGSVASSSSSKTGTLVIE